MTRPIPPAGAEADEQPKANRTVVVLLAIGLLVAAGAVLLVVLAAGEDDDGLATRRVAVERRGAAVMPFDQDRTRHRFTPDDRGGVQTVTALDPDDAEQMALVRQHLEEERSRFEVGDLGDPAAIHGHDMPGLAVLEEAGRTGRLRVTYAEVEAGARLTYRADDPAVVEAVHQWFEAQVMDHGAHASG